MLRRTLTLLVTALFAFALFARSAEAAPEAHILRIDPRAGMTNGVPLLTTVVEVVQFNSLFDVIEPCKAIRGYNELLDCWSNALEKPNALYTSFAFPEASGRLSVRVEGAENLAKFASKADWGSAQKEPLVGTAWLIALDASSSMGSRYADARQVAHAFIGAMQPNDLMNIVIFDDRIQPLVADSKWKTFKERDQLVKVLSDNPGNSPSHGRDRPLFDQIKTITRSSFGQLGNTQGPQAIPLHQAMVVLSNGAGRNDPSSISQSAELFRQFMNKGRFPDDNSATPKTPLPVISIFFPNPGGGLADSLYRTNDAQFMQSLANIEIGGFFDIVRAGQGPQKAPTIIKLVRDRFNRMHIVKWRLSCLEPKLEQSFLLGFVNAQTPIKPDASFKDVPIGVDPSQWPLDINLAQTKAEADANPVHPGGEFRVYGDFCWGTDKGRAAAYFVPAGTRPDPNTNSSDPEVAKRAMQHLTAQGMKAVVVEADPVFVKFQAPDDERILEGSGENAVTRLVVADLKAGRGSGHTEQSILTLKAEKKPLNWLLFVGIGGGVVVIVLLIIVAVRGGGNSKRRSSGPQTGGGAPPAQGGYGYGGPQAPPGGGYGAPPPGGYGGGANFQSPGAPPGGIVQVQCPSCKNMTMATVGQASVCFSCGQPLPAHVVQAGGQPSPQFR